MTIIKYRKVLIFILIILYKEIKAILFIHSYERQISSPVHFLLTYLFM